MAKCLRCGAGSEWLQGDPPKQKSEKHPMTRRKWQDEGGSVCRVMVVVENYVIWRFPRAMVNVCTIDDFRKRFTAV